jgi:hypothetical protein
MTAAILAAVRSAAIAEQSISMAPSRFVRRNPALSENQHSLQIAGSRLFTACVCAL